MWERVITINENLSYKPTHTHRERSINCGMHELFMFSRFLQWFWAKWSYNDIDASIWGTL